MGHRGRGKAYPWEEWFKLGRVVLEQGKDFKGSVSGMMSTARQAARRRKPPLRISVHLYERSLVMEVVGRAAPGEGRNGPYIVKTRG